MTHSTSTRSIETLAALLLILFLAGCGQSGPLYLPGNPSEMQELPAEQVENSEDDDDDEDKPDDEG